MKAKAKARETKQANKQWSKISKSFKISEKIQIDFVKSKLVFRKVVATSISRQSQMQSNVDKRHLFGQLFFNNITVIIVR